MWVNGIKEESKKKRKEKNKKRHLNHIKCPLRPTGKELRTMVQGA
jgi:hypothetical protein